MSSKQSTSLRYFAKTGKTYFKLFLNKTQNFKGMLSRQTNTHMWLSIIEWTIQIAEKNQNF